MTQSSGIDLSDGIIELAREAGYALTPVDSTGATVFWSDPGGEIRVYLRTGEDGWVNMTRADRASGESFVFAGRYVNVVERFLADFFGTDVRAREGLPSLQVPTREDALASGYSIADRGDGFLYLSGADGDVLARTQTGRVGTMNLVVVSHLCAASIDDIRRTYRDPFGHPIFPQTR